MKYEHYDIEDYLKDPYFIEWVKHPESEKNGFWEEWIRSRPDHRKKIFQAREVLLAMQFQHLEPDEEEYRDVLRQVLRGKRSHNQRDRKTSTGILAPLVSVLLKSAAVLLMCVAGAAIWFEARNRKSAVPEEAQAEYVIKQNPKGQRSVIKLPDGSNVTLNAESEISYQEDFGGDIRKVVLKGEAYFEIARDTLKPFIVQAAGTYTRALGTSFNIKAYDQEATVEVSLTSGEVEVGHAHATKEDTKILLQPGQKAVYWPDSKHFKKDKVDYELDISWKKGTIYFKNAGFEEVTRRLERWYDVEFIVTEGPYEPWHYYGAFNNSSLASVLKRLAYVQTFTYTMKGRKVYISFKRPAR